jgi:enediyne biosynthesis protein E4
VPLASPKQRALSLLIVLAATALLNSCTDAPPPKAASAPAAPDTAAFLALERTAAEHDRTTWAGEIEAMRLGGVIVSLWDELRRATNAFEVLAKIEFQSLDLPAAEPPSPLENRIDRRSLRASDLTLSPAEFREYLHRWQNEGYSLAQSDWRQIAFDPNDRRSTFAVELHLAHPRSDSRHQLRFNLDVAWHGDSLGKLRVHSGEIVSQAGPPQFSYWFNMELPLIPGLETLDPMLAVYDLNADSRPEIALVLQNTILRPKGERFAPEQLCAFPPERPKVGIFGDFDRDGTVDYLCAIDDRLLLYRGTSEGTFPTVPLPAWISRQPLPNPFVLTAGDIDRDGDLDLFLAQYKLPYLAGQMPTPWFDANDGFPSYLLVNDGRGHFTDATPNSGLAPKRHRRTYSASFIDLDRDGDDDLVVVSDFAGLDLYLNDGTGEFQDVTAAQIAEPRAFGMAHALADFDLDGSLDLLMIGMNSDAASRLDSMNLYHPGDSHGRHTRSAMTQGNRLYSRAGGRWRDRAAELNIAQAGWAWGVTAFDSDGDSDTDLYLVNGHVSRQTAADYESQFWRHDIHLANSEHNRAAELYFQSAASKLYGAGWSYGGFHKNKFFLNQSGTNFTEVGFLVGLALEQDCRNLVSADLDFDGDRDILLTTFQTSPRPRQSLLAFRNHSPLPARDSRPYVTGDSYRSQHPRPVPARAK